MEAMHNDDGKPRWDLAPWRAFGGVIAVLTYGCKKYAERNWEGGMRYSRLFASCLRHMLQWWLRNDMDPESGLHHLKHAATNLCMLVDYIERGLDKYDDRPNSGRGVEVAGESGEGVGGDQDVACVEAALYGLNNFCAHRGFRFYRPGIGAPFCDDCGRQI